MEEVVGDESGIPTDEGSGRNALPAVSIHPQRASCIMHEGPPMSLGEPTQDDLSGAQPVPLHEGILGTRICISRAALWTSWTLVLRYDSRRPLEVKPLPEIRVAISYRIQVLRVRKMS